MYDTTANSSEALPADRVSAGRASAFPDDELRQLLQHLVRAVGMLEPNPEPHQHGGVRVSTSEVFALGELAGAESLSQQELGARLGLEKSTVSRLAAGLESRGWLSREREPANRRLYRLALTPSGREVAQRVGDDLRGHHAQLLAMLTDAERHGLTVGLGGLIRAMEAHGRHSDGVHEYGVHQRDVHGHGVHDHTSHE